MSNLVIMFKSLASRAQFYVGVAVAVAMSIAIFVANTRSCYEVSASSYTKIEEVKSPDGKKIAVVFKEEQDSVDKIRHVRILKEGEKFIPSLLAPNRVHYYWQEEPHFEFSCLKPVKLDLCWKDSDKLLISYPLEEEGAITYQQSKGVSTGVDIFYECK